MKKIILTLLIFMSFTTFANKPLKPNARFTSDGKLHIEKLLGDWFGGIVSIQKDKNNNYYLITEYDERVVLRLYVNKNKLQTKNKSHIIGYDTYYKAPVVMDSSGKITWIWFKKAPNPKEVS